MPTYDQVVKKVVLQTDLDNVVESPTGGYAQCEVTMAADGTLRFYAPGAGGSVEDDSITNAKLANMAQATVKGRAAAAGTGDPVDLTAAQLLAVLDTNSQVMLSDGSRTFSAAPSSAVAGSASDELVRVAEFSALFVPLSSSVSDLAILLGARTMTCDFVIGSGQAWAVPTSEAVMFGSFQTQKRHDLSGFLQVRLHVKHNAAAVSGTKIRLKYAASLTTTIGSYSTIGTSEVQVSLGTSAGAQVHSTGWIDLVPGAKADVFIAPTGLDGNGSTNPNFITVYAEFR